MARALFLLVLLSSPGFAWQNNTFPVEIHVDDGQLVNQYFRVFLANKDISSENKPFISLQITHLFRKRHLGVTPDETGENWALGKTWKHPVDIYPRYTHSIIRNGNAVPVSGTLLIFDLAKSKILPYYQPTVHIIPELSWVEKPTSPQADGSTLINYHLTTNSVFLGNRFASFCWSFLPILITCLLVVIFSRKHSNGALAVLRNDQGHYSLSRCQITIWTLAIGSMVATYGLIQLEVPVIPQTLVIMMGLSLATSTTQSIKENAAENLLNHKVYESKGMADIILDNIKGTVSLPKAQMLFWTVVNICLFFYKSIIDGALWPIPAEMVALMGASQAGYLLKDIGYNQTPPTTPPPTTA